MLKVLTNPASLDVGFVFGSVETTERFYDMASPRYSQLSLDDTLGTIVSHAVFVVPICVDMMTNPDKAMNIAVIG